MNKELLKLYAKELIKVQIEWLNFEEQFNAQYRKSMDFYPKLYEMKTEIEQNIESDIDNDNLKFPIEVEVKSEIITILAKYGFIEDGLSLSKVPFNDFIKLARVSFIRKALFKDLSKVYDEMSNYLKDKEKNNSESLLANNIYLLRSIVAYTNKKYDGFSYDMMEYYYEELSGIGQREYGSIDQALIDTFNRMSMITISLMKLEGKEEYGILAESLMKEQLIAMTNSSKENGYLNSIDNIINIIDEYNGLIVSTSLRKPLSFTKQKQSAEKVMKKS